MLKLHKLLFILFLLLNFNISKADDFNKVNQLGLDILKQLSDSNFARVSNWFDSSYKSYYSKQTLEKDWYELVGTYGAYKSAKITDYQETQGYLVAQFKIKFDYLNYVMAITLNPKMELVYLAFIPAHKIYVTPDYVDVAKIRDTTVTFKSGEFEFPGILTMPKNGNKMPIVIIVGEAGPTDKDFTFGENKPYKDLAGGLATQGFASFRYDKRAQRYPMFLLRDKIAFANFTCREDYLDDLYNAIDEIKKLNFIDADRIYILGHGQGGMLTPLIAKERKDVKGIILMGANSVSLQNMMRDQYDYLIKVTPDKKDEYEEQKRLLENTYPPKLKWFSPHDSMPYGIQATYFVWLNEYNQLEVAKKLKKPMLILQADRDYQVNMHNFKLWQKGLKKKKNVTYKNYEKLNHMFYEGQGESTYSEYYIIGNLPSYLITDIADWLKTN